MCTRYFRGKYSISRENIPILNYGKWPFFGCKIFGVNHCLRTFGLKFYNRAVNIIEAG
jgi:hypothetical protein